MCAYAISTLPLYQYQTEERSYKANAQDMMYTRTKAQLTYHSLTH